MSYLNLSYGERELLAEHELRGITFGNSSAQHQLIYSELAYILQL